MKTTARYGLVAATMIVTLLFSTSPLKAQTASIKEERQVFPTYPFGDPNPVARMNNIYPYFRFEGYSASPTTREWKIVTLENAYIKVLIAPEIGGKILGAFEKATGQPFIYFNRVVKFREIAMRGPWTSGGIEFNFGDIGHAPSTSNPVDYMLRVNPDSSVSCVVGTMDLASRTEWRVEIRLPKDRAYFETRSFWYNPTELSTSLYHWMNAAADADSDLTFAYPGTAYIDHGGNASPWPLNQEGRDLSLYRNNAFGPSKSYHVLGSYTDFFALTWRKRDFGVAHWADYVDKPGKKLWLWALSREGDIWKDLLTDPGLGNKQYVEFQSGLLFNQAGSSSSLTPFKHRSFAPFSEERFTEAWFPFKGIGGVVEANMHGALNVERKGAMLSFGISPLEAVHDELVVASGTKEIYRRTLILHPMQAFVDSAALPPNEDFTVRLGSLLQYRSGDSRNRELERPREANPGFDWNTVGGLAAEASERARERDYTGALEKYSACLAKDSLYTPALTGTAEILYRQMEYTKALSFARKALANDAYDPTANFLYGSLQRRRGNLLDAKDGFGNAARSIQYRSAANTELAEVACLQHRWEQGIAYADRALDYSRYSIRALRARAVAFRMLGQKKDAALVQEQILQLDPLSHFARVERYLSDPGEKNRHAFVSWIQTELPAEVYLELASYYYVMGLPEDALRTLTLAPTHPIVCYWRAYLNHRLGNQREAETWLRKGAQGSPYLVFPFRNETAEVLEWAQSRSDDWTTRYYLGLIYWNRGRLDDARRLFASCGDGPRYAPFYITRGNLFRSANDALALRDYQRAVTLGQDEWRSYAALASFQNDCAAYGEALATLQDGARRFPANYVLQFEYARSLLYNQKYQECLAVLDTIQILPFEGAGYGRELHRQAAVLRSIEMIRVAKHTEALQLLSKAREWPERLGVGKPYDVENRIEDYLEGLCRMHTGDTAAATALLLRVVQRGQDTEARDVQYIIHLLALEKLGRASEAGRLLDRWVAAEPRSPVTTWASLIIHKERRKAVEFLRALSPSASRQWNAIPSDPNFPLVREIATLPAD